MTIGETRVPSHPLPKSANELPSDLKSFYYTHDFVLTRILMNGTPGDFMSVMNPDGWFYESQFVQDPVAAHKKVSFKEG